MPLQSEGEGNLIDGHHTAFQAGRSSQRQGPVNSPFAIKLVPMSNLAPKRLQFRLSTLLALTLSVGLLLLFASWYNPTGLQPGDIYCQGLDVSRDNTVNGIRVFTIYGKEVQSCPSFLQDARLGERKPRFCLALIEPNAGPKAGYTLGNKGYSSEHGEDHSVLRETVTYQVFTAPDFIGPSRDQKVSYEYDGRNRELKIEEAIYQVEDGDTFVLELNDQWRPEKVFRFEPKHASGLLNTHSKLLISSSSVFER